MFCTCDDEGTCAIYSSHERKSRKVRKCCECGNTINIGDTYQDSRGLFEGNWYVSPTCEHCEEIREALTELGYCIPDESLAEYYHEYLQSIGSDKDGYDILRNQRKEPCQN